MVFPWKEAVSVNMRTLSILFTLRAEHIVVPDT